MRKGTLEVTKVRYTDDAQLRRIPSDVGTRGSITAVGLISGFIIFAQTWSPQHFKTCRCSYGPVGTRVFSPYLFIYFLAGLDFWGQWSAKLLCKYILFSAWQFCCLHRNWSSYSSIKAITRQWGQAQTRGGKSVRKLNGMYECKDTVNADKKKGGAPHFVSIKHKGWLPFASEISMNNIQMRQVSTLYYYFTDENSLWINYPSWGARCCTLKYQKINNLKMRFSTLGTARVVHLHSH